MFNRVVIVVGEIASIGWLAVAGYNSVVENYPAATVALLWYLVTKKVLRDVS